MNVPAPSRSGRLDPVGRPRRPRRGTMLRAALVAVLLLTAAGVLFSGGEHTGGEHGGGEHSVGEPAQPTPRGAEEPPGDGARRAVPDGMVGVPVPLGEPASLTVLAAGDQVDLLAVPEAGDPAPVASDVAVLAVDHTSAAVLLSLPPEQAREVVSAPTSTRFAVIVVASAA